MSKNKTEPNLTKKDLKQIESARIAYSRDGLKEAIAQFTKANRKMNESLQVIILQADTLEALGALTTTRKN